MLVIAPCLDGRSACLCCADHGFLSVLLSKRLAARLSAQAAQIHARQAFRPGTIKSARAAVDAANG